MSVSGIAELYGIVRARGPFSFDLRRLNRLIGRGGRVADTRDPDRYAELLRRLLRLFDRRLRYGFMLPVNLLINGIVDHDIYNEPRIPQLAPMITFREDSGLWRVRAILAVRNDTPEESAKCEKLTALYGDCGVEMLVLTPEMIDGDYLQSEEFANRLNQAIFPKETVPPASSAPTCEIAVA